MHAIGVPSRTTPTDENGLVVRLVSVRVQRPAQVERTVGVATGGHGGQAEGSVRLPRTHPHHERLLTLGQTRRVAAAATISGRAVAGHHGF